MIRTVLFDLDGTLLDTAPDLAFALNQVLQEQGRPALPLERIRPVVSHGTAGLLRIGFGLRPEDKDFAPLRQRLLDIYQAHLACATQPFPGIEALLAELERAGLRWGVVTNKPGWLTEPLLQQLGLAPRSACIVSGDTTTRRKPDPEPLLHACALAGCHAPECPPLSPPTAISRLMRIPWTGVATIWCTSLVKFSPGSKSTTAPLSRRTLPCAESGSIALRASAGTRPEPPLSAIPCQPPCTSYRCC